jgi:hypothetical protein
MPTVSSGCLTLSGYAANNVPVSPCGPDAPYTDVTISGQTFWVYEHDATGSASVDPVTLKGSGGGTNDFGTTTAASIAGTAVANFCANMTAETAAASTAAAAIVGLSGPDSNALSRALAQLPSGGLAALDWGRHVVITPILDTAWGTDPVSQAPAYTGAYTTTTHTLSPSTLFSEILYTEGTVSALESFCGPVLAEDGSGNYWWKISLFAVELTGLSYCEIKYPNASSACQNGCSRQFTGADMATQPLDLTVDHSAAFGYTRLYWQCLCECNTIQDVCPLSGGAALGPTSDYGCSCYPANWTP